MDTEMIAAQAHQDRQWMEFDAWYEAHDSESLLELIDIIDCEPEDGPAAIRSLDDHGAEVVRRLALHVFREMALRNVQKEDGEE
jgi:hypothetical protein